MGKRKHNFTAQTVEEPIAKRARRQKEVSNSPKVSKKQDSTPKCPTPSAKQNEAPIDSTSKSEAPSNKKLGEAQNGTIGGANSSGKRRRKRSRGEKDVNSNGRIVKPGTCPTHPDTHHRPEKRVILHPERAPTLAATSVEKRGKRAQKKAEDFESLKARAKAQRKGEKIDTGTKSKDKKNHKTKKLRRLEAESKTEVAVIKQDSPSTEDFPALLDSAPWNISKPAGGRFLDHDPVFSEDEKYLFLATRRGVHVYSTSTSLLVRTYTTNPLDSVAAYALSPTNSNHLYIANTSGRIILWDWDAGREIFAVPTHWPIRVITVVQLQGSDFDTVFTIETSHQPKKTSHIVARQFRNNSVKTQPLSLWFGARDLISLRILDSGNVIFAASTSQIIMGSISARNIHSSNDSNATALRRRYLWRIQECNELLTCFDATARQRASGKVKKPYNLSHMMYDLVWGGVQGTLYIYEDFLHKMEQRDATQNNSQALAPRVIRWHREAVGAVKWSLDGNYILSGGRETVLCLWQLETGKRQDLPHLASAIESLTISPKGISYAIKLADNSVMVLSTTELKPRANIPSIQSLFVSPQPSLRPTVETNTSIPGDSIDPLDCFGRTPVVANSRNAHQLLLAVPASQNVSQESNTPASAPFLQTFDVFTSSHVSRQALTRNNATSRNSGPEGNHIQEPSITHLQISADGRWLASVEEWTPPAADVDFAVSELTRISAERQRRLETYLKFWSWNTEREHWVLETRVDCPHQARTDPFANKVFDLVAHHDSTAFATIGEDGLVRTWRPKTKMSDGVVLRGANNQGVVSWSCNHIIGLEKVPAQAEGAQDLQISPAPTNGKLAYSNDGSILAAALENPDSDESGVVHFLNTLTGVIKNSENGMYIDNLVDIGFLDRHFIILSEDIRVWDIVTNKLIYGIKLRLPIKMRVEQVIGMCHLAVNLVSNTFAIAVPTTSNNDLEVQMGDLRSTVSVIDPTQPEALSYFDTSSPVTALVSLRSQAGYAVIDSSAEFRIISPKASGTFIAAAPTMDSTVSLTNGHADEVENGEIEAEDAEIEVDEEEEDAVAGTERAADDSSDDDIEHNLQDEKAVVRPEQLARVFDRGSSFALPSVQDLFEATAGLYGGKPGSRVGTLG